MSTLKVGTIQDHTNSNTAINIDSSCRVFTPQRPMFKISGRTNTSYTPPINNSTAFQFGNTVFVTNGFTVSNTFLG